MKVLITGAFGRVGPQIIPLLPAHLEIQTFDLPGRGADFEGDLSQIEPLRQAMRGVEVVVHLAATSDDAPFLEEILPPNVIGLWNTFEAARLEGVRRFVFASSCQADGQVPQREEEGVCLETDLLPRPNNLYGACKVLGESMGRIFYKKHGLEFIALRIGAFQPYDSNWLARGKGEAIWLSPRDGARIITLAVEKPGVKYAVVNATSKTSREQLPLEGARRALGYEPQDDTRDFFAPATFEKSPLK